MSEHRIGTREEWQAARGELLQAENEHAERSEELAKRRRELPWVAVEKEYAFDTDEGTKTLAELFDGRSQLLAYNIRFGPDYAVGACPGCSNLADHLDVRAPQPPRRDAARVLARPSPGAPGLQGAHGLAVPLGLNIRERLPVRLRPGAHRAADG
jgi:predicted dithiol-disulfide oxidoreductase (DUF899 family)